MDADKANVPRSISPPTCPVCPGWAVRPTIMSSECLWGDKWRSAVRLASSSRTSLSATRLLAMLGNLQWGCDVTATGRGRKGGGRGGREGATGRRGLLDKRLLTRSDVSCCAGMCPHISGRDGGRWIIDNTRPTDRIDWMLLLLLPSVSVIAFGRNHQQVLD